MGISHLLEHMVFKGTERARRARARPGAGGAGRQPRRLHRRATPPATRPMCSTRDLPLAVDVLTDLVRRPLLRQTDLDLERKVILEEISGVEDTPDDLVFELHAPALWPEHPYGYSILGTRETVSVARHRRPAAPARPRPTIPATASLPRPGNVEHEVLLAALEREGWFEGEAPAGAPGRAAGAGAARGAARTRRARHHPGAHRARYRYLPHRRPAALRDLDPGERAWRRHVEPAVPAGAGRAGPGLRGVRLQPVPPGHRAARHLRRHAAGDGRCGAGGDPGGARDAWRPRA